MLRRAAIELLLTQPAKAARWCGLDRLTDELHGRWLQDMLTGRDDLTLLAHRGSYKTSCLAFAMAAIILLYPRKNILFMRKTDDDVVEIIRQVKLLLRSDAMQYLGRCIYGEPVRLERSDMYCVHTSCFSAMRGTVQLLGMGTAASLTGKHADIIITDDIVNLQDRCSAPERRRTREIWQELQNIRNPGGRIISAGTPWHPEDAISLMPNVRRYDCYRTGLLSPEQLAKLRDSMEPSLFAANYELQHIASRDALFADNPPRDGAPDLLRDGVAHLDAAYGGGDFTALTCGRISGGRAYLYGRLWRRPADELLDDIIGECDRMLCAPILCETNGDKGYLARELRERGAAVRTYAEASGKYMKIATWLRKWWKDVIFIEGTDPAYIRQILDYSADASHDDAPDSAASLLRCLDRRQ